MSGGALVGLGGVALFAASGFGLAELLPALRALPLPRRLAYAYLLGIGWIAGGLYLLSHLFAVPLDRPAVLGLALPPIAGGVAARLLQRGSPVRPRRRLARVDVLALVVAIVVSSAVLADALTNPVIDWDGRMTWGAQARFVRAARTVDAPVLQEARWFVTHPRYPLLLPLAQVAVLDLAGEREDAFSYRPLYAAFLPVFLLLVYDGARRWAGRRAAALAVLAAALVPFLAFSPEGGAASAYSDLPLACFYGAALLLLLQPRLTLSHGIAAGLLLSAAVLVKREGAPFALGALAIALLPLYHSYRRGGRWRAMFERLKPVGLAALVVAPALAVLASWTTAIPQRYDEGYENLVKLHSFWPAAVTRLPILLPVLREQMFSRWWVLFWWVTPFVLLLGRRGLLRRRIALPATLAIVVPLAVVWAAYAINEHPEALATATWNRFLMHAGIPLFLLLALALRDLLRSWQARPPHPPTGRTTR